MFTRSGLISAMVIGTAILASAQCLAGVPAMMSYQGRLTNSSGDAVADGAYDMRFYLYDQETGGNLLWQEPLPADPAKSVQVTGGVFNVLLGSTVPIVSSSFQGSTWLQTQMNGEAMTPRVRIVSSGYSFLSDYLSLPFLGTTAGTGAAFSMTNTGGGSAGYFKMQNISSSSPALEAASTGPGPAIRATNSSSGLAGQFVGKITVSSTAEVGSFKMTNSAGMGKVLTSDGAGVGTWQLPVGATSFYTNVKDYGAKGDGVTDDTVAIQAAMDAAAPRNRSEPFPGGGSYINSNAAVFFPSGRYNISNTINLRADVIGEGQAIVYQTNSSKDIFYNSGVWRSSIHGMGFAGGRDQIVLGTNNIDSSRIIIEKCQFNRATGCAIRILQGSNSTLVEIEDCTFIHCNQVFINWCDMARMANCWISTLDTMANKAVIENHGNLKAENICGVPWPVAANDQRWIDNYGVVACYKFRFGGEGAGFTPVVNFATYAWQYPVIPSSVILDDCDIYAVGNPARKCVVYCEEIPNQISITNCRGMIDLTNAIVIRPTINLSTYLDNGEFWSWDTLKFHVDRSNTAHPSILDLPEQLRPHQTHPIEADAKPTTGNWKYGTFIRNRQCYGTGSPFGWLCTTSGEPGTWVKVNPGFSP